MERKETAKKEKTYDREIEIPSEVEAHIAHDGLTLKKGGKELKRKIPGVILEKKENKITIKTKNLLRKDKKKINSAVAHIKNMLQGLDKDYIYKLQICAIHFPMNVSVKDSWVAIKNFLGETKDRKARIVGNTEVKISKEIIEVSSADKEAAGQTAANIEKAAKVTKRDRRIFQDGIFMIEKSGEPI